jgi:uncharacterized membrane protein
MKHLGSLIFTSLISQLLLYILTLRHCRLNLKKINERTVMAVFYVGTIGDKLWFGFCLWREVKSINNGS